MKVCLFDYEVGGRDMERCRVAGGVNSQADVGEMQYIIGVVTNGIKFRELGLKSRKDSE